MALSSKGATEVRDDGDDTNAGFFRGCAAISPPSVPTLTPTGTGGSLANGTYYIVLTYNDVHGETTRSSQSSVTTTGVASRILITSPTAAAGAVSWNAYMGTVSGGPYFPMTGGSEMTLGVDLTYSAAAVTTGTGPPGTDYSQQVAAQVSYTDIVIDGTTNTLGTSAGTPFTQSHVGNTINITSGTGFTVQTVEILNVNASGVATFDKSLGTLSSTGGTGKLGGAKATLGGAGAIHASQNLIFLLNRGSPGSPTVYTNGSTSNVSGGRLTLTNGNAAREGGVIGYKTNRTRTNTDERPIVRTSANSVVCITTGIRNFIYNLDFDNGGSFTSSSGISAGSLVTVENCRSSNQATPFTSTAGARFLRCEVIGFTTRGFTCAASTHCFGCVARDATGNVTGFSSASVLDCDYVACVVSGLTNASSVGFNVNGNSTVINCVAEDIGNTGFTINADGNDVINCVAMGCGTVGFNAGASNNHQVRLVNCAGYNNTANVTALNPVVVIGFITLSANPFTNATSLDFTLNNTAGGGALLRAAGYPSSLPGLTGMSYSSVGAFQPDPGASSGPTYFAF